MYEALGNILTSIASSSHFGKRPNLLAANLGCTASWGNSVRSRKQHRPPTYFDNRDPYCTDINKKTRMRAKDILKRKFVKVIRNN